MLQVLVYYRESKDLQRLSQIAKSRGMLVESRQDTELSALHLDRLDRYAAILVDKSFPWEFHLLLTQHYWEANIGGVYAAFSFSKTRLRHASRLHDLGIVVIPNADVENQIVSLLEKILSVKKKSPRTILLIDNIASSLKVLRKVLSKVHYTTYATLSGEDGWRELNFNPNHYFLVITELKTCDISGQELIVRVRASKILKHIPILVLTSHGTAKLLWESIMAGASGFLVKPPQKNMLVAELGRARRIQAGLEQTRLISTKDSPILLAMMKDQGLIINPSST
jgi:CheY-like chemotaxis protein